MSGLPELLRAGERRVNAHVWGDRQPIVSIPADVSRDIDILLLCAADRIVELETENKKLREDLATAIVYGPS